MVIKAQPSLFVFNEDSHLEGIMHYNTTLNSIADSGDQWQLADAELLDEEEEDSFEEEEGDFEDEDEDEDEDEEGYDYDFDEDELEDMDEEDYE